MFEFWRQPLPTPTPKPIPARTFPTVLTSCGPHTSGQWWTDTQLLSGCQSPLPSATSCILQSRGVGMSFRNIFAILKGNLLNREILTLAINTHKQGNLSCFIMLSRATQQHWGPLIGKTKDKLLTLPFSNLSISSSALCPSRRVPHAGLAAGSCDCIALKRPSTVFQLAQKHLFNDL